MIFELDKNSQRKRHALFLSVKRSRNAFLMLLPMMLFFAIFVYYPLFRAFSLSFFEYHLFMPKGVFVGLSNYWELLKDTEFRSVLANTVYYAFFTVSLGTLVSLMLALLVNYVSRGGDIYKVIYFIPTVTPLIAISILWKWIYDPQLGILNYALSFVGLGPFGWLASPKGAMPAVILMSIWKNAGFNMLIFLAGLSSIPRSYYEAAFVDGANGWQAFRYITIPLLKPVSIFIVVTSVIQSFQVFGQIYVMTQGGPMGATKVIVFEIFEKAFRFMRMGYAAAMSFALFGIIIFFTYIQMKAFRSE